MSDVKYLSEAWCEEAAKKLQEELTPDIPGDINVSTGNHYLKCPDGVDKYTYISIVDGRLDRMETGQGEAPDADFTITAEYAVFVQLVKGELSGQSAMLNGRLKLKGNMMKALKFMPISDRIIKILAAIPTEY